MAKKSSSSNNSGNTPVGSKEYTNYGYVYYYYDNIKHKFQPRDLDDIYMSHLNDFRKKRARNSAQGLNDKKVSPKEVDRLAKEFKAIDREGNTPEDYFFKPFENGIDWSMDGKEARVLKQGDLNNIGYLWTFVENSATSMQGLLTALKELCWQYLDKDNGLFAKCQYDLVVKAIDQGLKNLTLEQESAIKLFFPNYKEGQIIDLESFKKKYGGLHDQVQGINEKIKELERYAKQTSKNVSGRASEKKWKDDIRGTEVAIINSLMSFKGSIEELVGAMAFANADDEFFNNFKDREISITGSDPGIIIFKEDPELKRRATQSILKESEINTTSKSDITVKATRDGVTVRFGISVKNYAGYKNIKSLPPGKKLGNIKILSTNLLALLTNFIGYNDSDFFKVLNLLSAIPAEDGEREDAPIKNKTSSRAQKQKDLEVLISQLSAMSALSALTGIRGGLSVVGQTYSSFMLIGGRLISMEDILTKCMDSLVDLKNKTYTRSNPITILGLRTRNQSKGTTFGTYESNNKNSFVPASANGGSLTQLARQRSKEVIGKNVDAMRVHKINITLNSSIIIALLREITPTQ